MSIQSENKVNFIIKLQCKTISRINITQHEHFSILRDEIVNIEISANILNTFT